MKNPERIAELLAELKTECEYRFELDAVNTLIATVKELPRVKIIDEDRQEFLGKIYCKRKSSGHFYRSYNKINAGLHRVVWSHYYGEIPTDCEIHHVDGNPANNQIENLQCLTKAEHRRLHKAGKIERHCEFCGKKFFTRENLPGSFCSQYCHDQKRRKEKIDGVCEICGKKFVTTIGTSAKTCSKECACKLGQQTRLAGTAKPHRGRRDIRVCAFCGKEFEVRHDAKTKCCSMLCAQRFRHAATSAFR